MGSRTSRKARFFLFIDLLFHVMSITAATTACNTCSGHSVAPTRGGGPSTPLTRGSGSSAPPTRGDGSCGGGGSGNGPGQQPGGGGGSGNSPGQQPGGGGSGNNPGQQPATCPRDALKLGVCANLLGGLVGVVVGNPPKTPCCTLLAGLVDLEAAVCLCTAIRANALGIINLNVRLQLSLLLNVCGRTLPRGFTCA